jgi:hypothetical protein
VPDLRWPPPVTLRRLLSLAAGVAATGTADKDPKSQGQRQGRPGTVGERPRRVAAREVAAPPGISVRTAPLGEIGIVRACLG